jgi:hypothetical protein
MKKTNINLTQEQRFLIYQCLSSEFWKYAGKCMVMDMERMREDKFCAMGLEKFMWEKFVAMNDTEFEKMLIKGQKKLEKWNKNKNYKN